MKQKSLVLAVAAGVVTAAAHAGVAIDAGVTYTPEPSAPSPASFTATIVSSLAQPLQSVLTPDSTGTLWAAELAPGGSTEGAALVAGVDWQSAQATFAALLTKKSAHEYVFQLSFDETREHTENLAPFATQLYAYTLNYTGFFVASDGSSFLGKALDANAIRSIVSGWTQVSGRYDEQFQKVTMEVLSPPLRFEKSWSSTDVGFTSPVPEPAGTTMLIGGLLSLAWFGRRATATQQPA